MAFAALFLSFAVLSQQVAAGPWLVRPAPNSDSYPYAVHLPARSNYAGLPPLHFSLTGSGARGPYDQVAVLAGYDGAGFRIRQYNSGNTTEACVLAAEEFLTVVPISPADVPQSVGATWTITAFPSILAAVLAEFPYDTKRQFVSGYSMGSHGGWNFILANPGVFQAFAGAAGTTGAAADQLRAVQNLPIRQYAGGADEKAPAAEAVDTEARMDTLGANALQTTVYPGIGHLTMNDLPFDADLFRWLLSINGTTTTNSTSGPNATASVAVAASGAPSSIAAAGVTGTPKVANAGTSIGAGVKVATSALMLLGGLVAAVVVGAA